MSANATGGVTPTHSLSSGLIRLEDLQLEKTTAVSLQVPAKIIELIDQFQISARARFGRKPSRADAVLKMLIIGAGNIEAQIQKWDEEVEAANAINEEE